MDLLNDTLLFPNGVGTVYAIWLDEEVVEQFDVVSCFTEEDLYDKYDIEMFELSRHEARERLNDELGIT